MNYLSVCSGIEAATVAWHSLTGFSPVAFSEIEEFPSAVLRVHYPHVPNLGDMLLYKEWNLDRSIDLLVGGTPCQAFSVAGLRKGLDDPRGNLALVYLAIAHKHRPRWILWENVPGVFSSNRGGDFAAFLSGLALLGYGWAYRVLDAQYFGLAQRRKRVFVVGYLGDWRRAAAVLLERQSLRGDPPPSRTQKTNDQSVPQASAASGYKPWPADIAGTLTAEYGLKRGCQYQHINMGCPLFVPGVPNIAGTLRCRRPGEGGHETDVTHIIPQISHALTSGNRMNTPDKESYITEHRHSTGDLSIRRLTPIEFERLQGFPDNYTKISFNKKPPERCPDNPRYKALGNSMAVPVMRWLGRRMQMVDQIVNTQP